MASVPEDVAVNIVYGKFDVDHVVTCSNRPGIVNQTVNTVAGGRRLPPTNCDTSLVVSGGVDCERRRRNVYDKKL